MMLVLSPPSLAYSEVIAGYGNYYLGLSTDTKPTLSTSMAGYLFCEYDTSRTFIWSGASWSLHGRGYTASPDTLTAKGSSVVRAAMGFSGFTIQADVSDVDTHLYVYLEGKATNTTGTGGWSSLPSLSAPLTRTSNKNDSTVVDTNGTFMWRFEGFVDSVRATVSAGSGETTFQAVWRWIFGKEN